MVNIGSRQQFRESSSNVINVNSNYLEIFNAAIKQIEYGKYPSSKHLGDGDSGEKMCKISQKLLFHLLKKIIFVNA